MHERIRNHVARSALLRKGGVHERSRSAKRQSVKRELEQTVSDYLIKRDEKDHAFNEEEVTERWPFLFKHFYCIAGYHPKGQNTLVFDIYGCSRCGFFLRSLAYNYHTQTHVLFPIT